MSPKTVPQQTVSELLTELVAQAAAAAGHADVLDTVEPAQASSNPKFGDYQSNHAFRLGKALRTNPRAVAEQVRAQLPEHPAVRETSVAGPGFLNFRLSDDWLAQAMAEQANSPHRGAPQSGAGHTLVIDYSSPNIAKRMHVGHLRSTVIGNALHRLHLAAGFTVVADNHVGDWGTQYGKLIVGWRRWRDDDAYQADPVGHLETLYVRFGEEAADDESLMDAAREETAKLQAGDPENRELWERFVGESLKEFQAVYDRLNVSFDVTLGESFYEDMLPSVVEQSIQAGVARESRGAIIVDFPHAKKSALTDTVLIIRKQDGAYLYGTTDFATLDHRMATWSPSKVAYVTDKRQQLHFQQVFDGWTRLQAAKGVDTDTLPELSHIWFGTLNMKGGGAMSTRAGGTARLTTYLDEAVARALAVVKEKAQDLTEQEQADIAHVVGHNAVRYADLSQNPQSDLAFDLDRMLALDGNTAPFLMYSYARLRSIQRKGGADQPGVEGLAITAPIERELVLHMLQYGDALQRSLDNWKPSILCDYLYGLATFINRFYFQSPVLKAEEPLKSQRLALLEAAARVLGHGMNALGIQPIDRM